METFYSILGVDEDASQEEIKKAYKKKAILYHPDKVNNLGEKIRLVADMEFKRINEAKDVLLDKDRRKEYDETLHKAEDTAEQVLDTWPVESEVAYDTRVGDEFQKEVDALQNVIVGLNYEISLLKKNLDAERHQRVSLEKQVRTSKDDSNWMKKTLESLLNTYNKEIKLMDEKYRDVIQQLVDDLYVEIQMSDDEYKAVQKRIEEIQVESSRISEKITESKQFASIKEKFNTIKFWDDMETPAKIETEEVDISQGPQPEWDAQEYEEPPPVEPQVDEINGITDIDSELRKLEDLGQMETEKDYERSLNFEHQTGSGFTSTYLRQCPFCGREVNSDQSYCYYCGAVF